jgi:hypothetical protein
MMDVHLFASTVTHIIQDDENAGYTTTTPLIAFCWLLDAEGELCVSSSTPHTQISVLHTALESERDRIIYYLASVSGRILFT